MSQKREKSINAMLLEIAQPNRCTSKIGSSYSQQFKALQVKPAGDTSIINRHAGTVKKHMESNQLKESLLQKEGKMKVIKSDMKRSTHDRNSVKDSLNIQESFKEHKKTLMQKHRELLEEGAKVPKNIQLERVMPMTVHETMNAFKSPSRTQLQEYEAKETAQKPNCGAYRPKYDYVLKKEARPASLAALELNPGRAKKRELFERHVLKLCNRLATKIDRGHEIAELRKNASSVHSTSQMRAPGLLRRGSDQLIPGSLGRISSLDRSPRKTNLNTLAVKSTLNTKTAQVTGRKQSALLQNETAPTEVTVENFAFKRDRADSNFKTGQGPINVQVSRVNSIVFDHDYVDQPHHPKAVEKEFKIGKQISVEVNMRSTQPNLPPAITDFASKQPNEYANVSPSKGAAAKQSVLPRGMLKSTQKGSAGLITMSKVDSQLSIQNQPNNTRSIASLPPNIYETNRALPTTKTKKRQQSQFTTNEQKSNKSLLLASVAGSDSALNLSDHKKDSTEFCYDVTYATKNYHLVRNRNLFDNEDSIMLLSNEISAPTKLPSIKIHLQTNRPPNLAQLHDARFEEIDKEPKILSSIKKVKQIDFNKFGKEERHKCLINVSGDVSMQKYLIKEDVVKKNTSVGAIRFDKQYDWSQLIQKGDKNGEATILSHDSVKAANQLLKNNSKVRALKGGIIDYNRQGPRKFQQFQTAEQSEKMELQAQRAQNDEYMKHQRQTRQKAIMNIHSRLGVKDRQSSSETLNEQYYRQRRGSADEDLSMEMQQ